LTTTQPILKLQILPHGEGLQLPFYATPGSAGLDLPAAESFSLEPGQRAIVGTGLAMAIPIGFEGQVRPRSGLAFKHGISIVNAPGTIDADYRGEVKVLLVNLGENSVAFERGERIAQLVIAPVVQVGVSVVSSLEETSRGGGGFGSTGVS
jgi:dUTP pyrophosphatase